MHIFSDIFEDTNAEVAKIATCGESAMKDYEVTELFGRKFHIPSYKEISAVFLGEECITLQNLALALPGKIINNLLSLFHFIK